MAAPDPRPLTLSDEEQLTLLGAALLLRTTDLKTIDNLDTRRARTARRDKLRYLRRRASPDGRGDLDPIDAEERDVLGRRLEDVRKPACALQLLISVAGDQPWALLPDHRGKLDKRNRREILQFVVEGLPPPITRGHLKEIDRVLKPSAAKRARQRLGMRGVAIVGVGAVAGVATAGMAAPAIAAAIGGSMGLSGAAAASAGLAWLGGGAVAAGGAGMAGGTAVLGALGVSGGAGIGGAAAAATSHKAIEAQRLQLVALVKLGLQMDEETQEIMRDQVRLVDQEIARLIDAKSRARSKEERDTIEAELEKVNRLRRGLDFDGLEPQ